MLEAMAQAAALLAFDALALDLTTKRSTTLLASTLLGSSDQWNLVTS